MNRKFFNGLLLLSLATGGVGTFTSCTDHEQDFQNQVLQDQKSIADQIAAIRAFLGEPFDGSNLDERIKAVYEARVKAIEDRLNQIEETNEAQQEAIDAIKDEIEDIYKNYYDKAYIDEKIGKDGQRIVDLEEKAKLQQMALDKLGDEFAHFVGDVQSLFDRYSIFRTNEIKSVIVERTYNPVFGTLNLPIGLESNMLINYYAKPVEAVSFPSGIGENEGTNNDIFTPGFTLPIAAADVFTLGTGEVKIEKYGDLYMTINPLERNFSGQPFELVKSNGEALPAKFTAEEETEYIASFGYTRADNGFYKSTIAPAEGEDEALVNATKFEIENELKTAFKDVIKNHGKEDFAQLAKAIYSQFNGKVPAYAVKVKWDEPNVDGAVPDSVGEMAAGDMITKSVISGYDLAVATFYPLSYTTNALSDIEQGINKRLPLIGSLQSRFDQVFESLHNHLNLGFKDINVDDISIDLSKVTVNVQMDKVTIDLTGCPVYKADKDGNPILTEPVGVLGGPQAKVELGYDGTVEGVNGTALKPLVDAIKNAIEDMLNGKGDNSLTTQINSQLQEQIGNIVKQVNDQLASVQNKVYDSLTSIQDRVNAELNGSLGSAAQSLVNLYDAFAKRVNNFLDDPSYYLQSVMAYEAEDGGIHHLSTVKNDPTYVKAGPMKLFMTSYNAELIVPAFKKYVAIVKVDDADADAALNSKAGINLNKVLSGRQQTLGFNSAALESGKTYAIFYQTLDFRGHTSSHVYYIRVK